MSAYLQLELAWCEGRILSSCPSIQYPNEKEFSDEKMKQSKNEKAQNKKLTKDKEFLQYEIESQNASMI